MQPRTTISDLALRARCCKSTVSLALRNDPKISADTRARVHALASELGYRPDPVLARLAAHRWHAGAAGTGTVIAFIADEPSDDGATVMAGARGRAEELGYRFAHFRPGDYRDAAHLGQTLNCRGIRGAVLGRFESDGFAHLFPWDDFCVLACDAAPPGAPVHCVGADHAAAGRRLWQELERRGRQRPGLVRFADEPAEADAGKLAAFLLGQQNLPAGRQIPPLRLRPDDPASLRAWFRRHQPDVLIGCADRLYWWLRRAGISLPRDAGFVSLEHGGSADHRIAGLRHRSSQIGRTAVDQLTQLLHANQFGLPAVPLNITLEPVWRDGLSLPQAKRHARAAAAAPEAISA